MDRSRYAYVRTEPAQTLPPPPSSTGVIGWLHRNLFGSWLDTVLTLVALYIIWLVVPPIVNFAFVDAVWTGTNREACLGPEVGACWAFVKARLGYFIYGLYPVEERWRPDLVFLLGAIGIAWLLWQNAPKRAWGAAFFFLIYPVVAYFLLTGLPALGLPVVETSRWGGILVTLVCSVVGIVFSLPLGIVLALGRRSRMPVARLVSITFIEFVRGVPLITVLFMASVMLPLFMPGGVTIDKLLRALIGIALFASAYMAEVVRGGLQALPKGQYEAAQALGLSYWKMMVFVILPQALTIVIPGIVNTFIGLFKDTTLVFIVGIFDLLKTIDASLTDPAWATPVTRYSGYAFAAVFYFVFCFGMSRYSIYMEKRLSAGRRR
ncbi:general L-amino acid transport system permease protein [Tepidamorphus gemmatus]|uniref:General L-amino acid transport system permease protein n=1 Tax=Tepidamorphus gemmatus TaxID=747076 RepID=A0A4R3MCY4_9HYPH|nr:amino acid ABC transporter permease [Tepidamorphus gemmatus]TCT11401.1 general L-amino acid transport system permease protein [Tepidamorphus gemmatus]